MNPDDSDKIIVKRKPFDPFVYIHTVLEYARFDLTFQKRLTVNRLQTPLTQEEQEYFIHIQQHLQRAQCVLEELRLLHEDLKNRSILYRMKKFLRKLWPFS